MRVALSAVAVLLGVVAAAQAPTAVTVDQILDKYDRAIGGRAAFDRLTTRLMIGTFVNESNHLTLPVEIYAKAPDKRVQLLGFGEASLGFNGEAGWSMNMEQNGLRMFTGPRLAAAKREAIFNGESRLKELYATLTFAGTSNIGGREVQVIDATSSDAASQKLYFERQTGLLIRQAASGLETNFDDYREVDGIKLPFRIRRTFAGGVISTTFREIKHNVPIDDAKFTVPTP
jgi:hypothetical protein